jgi:hypothetical protein
MTDQTPLDEASRALNFADLFVDGCDTRIVMGAQARVCTALPDGSLVQLEEIYRGRMKPSDLRCEYCKDDVPAAWYPERAAV